jgi:hypothetical protein
MEEKKEEFLEKLGECYSISTKNETLSSEINKDLTWRRKVNKNLTLKEYISRKEGKW